MREVRGFEGWVRGVAIWGGLVAACNETGASPDAGVELPRDVVVDSDGADGAATTDGAAGDTSLPTVGLHVAQNHVVTSDGKPFHGRGANLHDTRSCMACAWSAPDPEGLKRWSDELLDHWRANFVRFDLSAYASKVQDDQVQWQSMADDPGYLADIVTVVSHMTAKPGVYVLVTLFADPTLKPESDDYDSEWPTTAALARYRALATVFAKDPQVLFGLTHEPHGDAAHDPELAALDLDAIDAIRDAEAAAGGLEHIIVVQAPEGYARDVGYFVAHPLARSNVAYEIHPYNHAADFERLIVEPSKHLPLIIGEYGPAVLGGELYMTDDDLRALWTTAQAAEVPYIAWNFHMRCPPNLLADTANDGCGLSAATGYDFPRTPWGDLLFAHLQTAW